MQYVIEYIDGNIFSSSDTPWRNLPRNKKIINFGIYDNDNNFHELENYDIWFFSDEASFSSSQRKFKWEARMIGGFKNSGEGKVIKVTLDNGYSILDADFSKYSKIYNDSAFIFNN